jgi:hypothetical protein
MQCKHLRRGCGDFIGSKIKRNQYRKPERNGGTKSSRKKSQTGEEGRRIFSESVEENPTEEDPVLNRPVCIHSISPVARAEGNKWTDAEREKLGEQFMKLFHAVNKR